MFYFRNHESLRSCTSSEFCQFTVQSIDMIDGTGGQEGLENLTKKNIAFTSLALPCLDRH